MVVNTMFIVDKLIVENRLFLKVLIKALGLMLFCMMFLSVQAAQVNQGEFKRSVPKRKASQQAIERIREMIALEKEEGTGVQKHNGHEIMPVSAIVAKNEIGNKKRAYQHQVYASAETSALIKAARTFWTANKRIMPGVSREELLTSEQLACLRKDESRRKRVSREKKRAKEQENSFSRERVNNDTVPAENKVQENSSITYSGEKRARMCTYRATWSVEDIVHLKAAQNILYKAWSQGVRGVPQKQMLSFDQLRCLNREKRYKERLREMGIQQTDQELAQLSGPVAMPVVTRGYQKPVVYKALHTICDPQLESASLDLLDQCNVSNEVSCMGIVLQEPSTGILDSVWFKSLRQEEQLRQDIFTEKKELEEKRYIDSFFVKEAFEEPEQEVNIKDDRKSQEVENKQVQNKRVKFNYQEASSVEDRAHLKEAKRILRELRKKGTLNPRKQLSSDQLRCLRADESECTKRYHERIFQKKNTYKSV